MTAQVRLWETLARELARRHAAHLRELGEVRVLALDPCPICMGRVVAGELVAQCTACSWSYTKPFLEPVASRRADP